MKAHIKKIIIWITAISAILSLLSCKNTDRKPLLPSISGKAGEVLIVINKPDWEGSVGTELRNILARDFPYLPQKEPLYTLINIVPAAFTDIFQIHRNIILINIDTKVTEPGVIFKSDAWARPQCVIAVNAADSETALKLIQEKSSLITSTLEQAERDRVIANSIQYEEHSLSPVVTEMIGGSPHFPAGYSLKKKTDDFIWISYETQYTNQGILIYKYPAAGNESDFTLDNIIAHRNEFLKNNVPGMFDNTYMTTSDAAIPGLSYLKYKGREFTEIRGLWDVHNDFMGGPFVSHSFYSQDGKEIIVLESFVYAARYDKRHYLRQVESILYSFEWKNNATKK